MRKSRDFSGLACHTYTFREIRAEIGIRQKRARKMLELKNINKQKKKVLQRSLKIE